VARRSVYPVKDYGYLKYVEVSQIPILFLHTVLILLQFIYPTSPEVYAGYHYWSLYLISFYIEPLHAQILRLVKAYR
jgi:hypothetical protein